jgi:hypothetical protein
MERSRNSAAVVGVILILLGVFLLAGQLVPGLWGNLELMSWPFIVVGVGVLLLVIGLLTNTPGLAVPACIVGGIGLLLYWQNATGNWESWAYAWTLIPGFVGVGVILMGLLEGRPGPALVSGGWLILISLVLFAIFASFMGGPVIVGKFWPVLLIVLGILGLVRYIIRSRG